MPGAKRKAVAGAGEKKVKKTEVASKKKAQPPPKEVEPEEPEDSEDEFKEQEEGMTTLGDSPWPELMGQLAMVLGDDADKKMEDTMKLAHKAEFPEPMESMTEPAITHLMVLAHFVDEVMTGGLSQFFFQVNCDQFILAYTVGVLNKFDLKKHAALVEKTREMVSKMDDTAIEEFLDKDYFDDEVAAKPCKMRKALDQHTEALQKLSDRGEKGEGKAEEDPMPLLQQMSAELHEMQMAMLEEMEELEEDEEDEEDN